MTRVWRGGVFDISSARRVEDVSLSVRMEGAGLVFGVFSSACRVEEGIFDVFPSACRVEDASLSVRRHSVHHK
jgi:hypothetical protein